MEQIDKVHMLAVGLLDHRLHLGLELVNHAFGKQGLATLYLPRFPLSHQATDSAGGAPQPLGNLDSTQLLLQVPLLGQGHFGLTQLGPNHDAQS